MKSFVDGLVGEVKQSFHVLHRKLVSRTNSSTTLKATSVLRFYRNLSQHSDPNFLLFSTRLIEP